MVCKNCGANIPNGELFCPNCGTCTENAKFCKYCGAVIGADCVVCPACGRQVEPLQSAQQPQPVYVINNVTYGGVAKSKWAAFFLCLFLGLIGAHKFYEGKIGMGVLYIFTGGLFGIGAIYNAAVHLDPETRSFVLQIIRQLAGFALHNIPHPNVPENLNILPGNKTQN